MTKSTFISIRECAERLTKGGDPIENQPLGRYIKRHGLERGKGARNAILVDFQEVSAHRKENFTRKWMKGEGDPSSETRPDSPKNPKNVTSIEPAREAKNRRESALADSAVLDLEERLGNLISLDQTEAGIALAAEAMRDISQGPTASDFSDRMLTKFGIPSNRKREFLSEVKTFGKQFQAALADTMSAQLSDLSGDPSSDIRRRHDQLAEIAFNLRHNHEAQNTA